MKLRNGQVSKRAAWSPWGAVADVWCVAGLMAVFGPEIVANSLGLPEVHWGWVFAAGVALVACSYSLRRVSLRHEADS